MIPILSEISEFTNLHKLKVNETKSKLMVFNPSKNYQFPLEIGFNHSKLLEVVSSAKILGVIVSNDLKWSLNTEYITKKALSRLWTLRRMKNLGLSNEVIFDVYMKEVRSILEFGVPVWNGGLTLKDSSKIENIQKKVFKILMQNEYSNYESACHFFGTDTLEKRRVNMCLKFAKKELLRDESSFFIKHQPRRHTRQSDKIKVEEIRCNSARYSNSSIPYLSRLLNSA